MVLFLQIHQIPKIPKIYDKIIHYQASNKGHESQNDQKDPKYPKTPESAIPLTIAHCYGIVCVIEDSLLEDIHSVYGSTPFLTTFGPLPAQPTYYNLKSSRRDPSISNTCQYRTIPSKKASKKGSKTVQNDPFWATFGSQTIERLAEFRQKRGSQLDPEGTSPLQRYYPIFDKKVVQK